MHSEKCLYTGSLFPSFVTALKDKVRSRYLVVKLETEDHIPRNLFIKAIRKAARDIEEGYYDEVGPWLTYFENNYGVIKYNHKKKQEMLVLFERIRLLDDEKNPVEIRALGISGTINKARKKYIP